MRSEVIDVTAFVIYDATRRTGRGMLDPITVIFRDFGGSGQIIVECFGAAWSHWFGAIGTQTLCTFIAGCDAGYVADKLMSTTVRNPAKQRYLNELGYLEDIANAVLLHMNGGAA
jgi:hypothetical protein